MFVFSKASKISPNASLSWGSLMNSPSNVFGLQPSKDAHTKEVRDLKAQGDFHSLFDAPRNETLIEGVYTVSSFDKCLQITVAR
jgi:hypothetical protein